MNALFLAYFLVYIWPYKDDFYNHRQFQVELLNVFCQPKPISDEIVTDVL